MEVRSRRPRRHRHCARGRRRSQCHVYVTDGSGWVGKGDVRDRARRLSNGAIETLVNTEGGVEFTYTVTDTYKVTEESGPAPSRTARSTK